jgi:hypothetical protein
MTAPAKGERNRIRFVVEPITLDLKTPFRIAHGVSTTRHNVLGHLGQGVGEAAHIIPRLAAYDLLFIVTSQKSGETRPELVEGRWFRHSFQSSTNSTALF